MDSTWDAGKDLYGYFLCSENDFLGHVRLDDYRTDEFMTLYPMSPKTFEDKEKTTSEENNTRDDSRNNTRRDRARGDNVRRN